MSTNPILLGDQNGNPYPGTNLNVVSIKSGAISSLGQQVLDTSCSALTASLTGDGTQVVWKLANIPSQNTNTQGTGWNPTTGVFTFQTSGYYLISFYLTFVGLSSSHTTCYLSMNGSTYYQSNPYAISSSGYATVGFSRVVNLDAGDFVSFLFKVSGGAFNVQVNANTGLQGSSFISIAKLF